MVTLDAVEQHLKIYCFRFLSGTRNKEHHLCPEDLFQVYLSVAFHLSKTCTLLSSRLIDENDVEIADETHFTHNGYNVKTLGFFKECGCCSRQLHRWVYGDDLS